MGISQLAIHVLTRHGGAESRATFPGVVMRGKDPASTRVTQFVCKGSGSGPKGASLNGISGQGIEVHRLRCRFYLPRGRAVVLSRQAVQERTQALQDVQD